MSKVNIKRAVENIRASTTVYTPIVEVIINAIQAIETAGRADGKITVRAQRAAQAELDGGLSEIQGFEIEDNGIGSQRRTGNPSIRSTQISRSPRAARGSAVLPA